MKITEKMQKFRQDFFSCPFCQGVLDKSTLLCGKCGYDRGAEIEKRFLESQRKRKESNNLLCSQGNHQMYLRHVGFGGGKVYWKCTNCGSQISEDDQQMTL